MPARHLLFGISTKICHFTSLLYLPLFGIYAHLFLFS